MGTHYQGTGRQKRSLSTFIKLMRAADSFSMRTFRMSPANRLSLSQFAVMEALFHLGPMVQKDLAGKLLKTAGNLTMVINNLESQGFVTRDRQLPDRRFRLIHLTPQGKQLIADIFPRHAEIITAEMSVLTAEEQEMLGTLCKKLALGK